MGRAYAIILGLLAFLTILARGLLMGASPESTLPCAWISLLTLSALGYVLGKCGSSLMDGIARKQVEAEWADTEQPATD